MSTINDLKLMLYEQSEYTREIIKRIKWDGQNELLNFLKDKGLIENHDVRRIIEYFEIPDNLNKFHDEILVFDKTKLKKLIDLYISNLHN